MTASVSDRDRELLSALLDKQLSTAEMQALEGRFAVSPELAAEWRQLQRLRSLLKALPRRKARRSFLIKRGSVPERKPSPFLFPMRLAAGLASAGLVIILALDALPLFSGFSSRAAAPMAPAAVSESLSAEKATSGEISNQIILWSTPTVEFYGKGGGPPSEEAGAADLAASAPAEPAAEALPAALPTEQPQPNQGAADSVQGESPILGIPPAEEQGKVIGEIRESTPEGTSRGFPIHPALELLLAAAAIGFAVASVVIGRRK